MVEEAIAKRYPEQQMRCPVHLSIGQEAAAVGICEVLTKDDLMVSTHRSHAHYLAKGGSLRGLLCELYGKKDGCSRGQGGSMHLVDWPAGFAGSTSIVGGTIPIGVGLAFAKKLRGDPGLVVVCIGDAAIETGVFHESANFAALHNLKVMFVCENNFFSCYTHISKRQVRRDFSDLARAYRLNYYPCDGNNVAAVANMAEIAGRMAPSFLELETWRHREHCGPNNDDHLAYRDPKEVEAWKDHDPLLVTERTLKGRGEMYGLTSDVEFIKQEIKREFEYAIKSEFPPQEWFEYASN